MPKALNINIPVEVATALNEYCAKHEKVKTKVVVNAIKAYIGIDSQNNNPVEPTTYMYKQAGTQVEDEPVDFWSDLERDRLKEA